MTMLHHLKGACWHSLTVCWSYVLVGTGIALNGVDLLAALAGDPTLNETITGYLHASPKALGAYTAAAGLITFAARMRSILKAAKAAEAS